MQNQKRDRFLRLPQIIGQKEITTDQAEANRKVGKYPTAPRPFIEPRIPVSRAAWWMGVKGGRYPKSIKLGSRTTVWRESEIEKLMEQSDELS